VPARKDAAEKIRIGIVSAHVYDQSVWNAIVKSWYLHLDSTQFELDTFCVGTRQDGETAWAKSRSAWFEQGAKNLNQWVEAIQARQPAVLVYPEIGMDPMTLQLASLRLAPVQVATWGHPETTGLPTMDYYLSAEDFEPANAQENYSEKLVRLPHLGCCYHPLPVTAAEPDFDGLNVESGVPVFVCPGTPFKYAPRHDRVFVEIARRAGRCRFVFFDHYLYHDLSEKLHHRLKTAFAQTGLNLHAHAVFIPWQPRAAFYGLLQRADVYLDTIGFSGFNTAMQAVECGLPMVTREGRFLRGRFGSGILRRLGLSELIAETEEDYIDLALKLAQDGDYRNKIRERMDASRHVLYGDLTPIRTLEDFLREVVKRR
jgi:predicted O-linked N-acetylglucosamine transferase (SPINDLY family)